jgi:N-acetylmuramate 1-kinase
MSTPSNSPTVDWADVARQSAFFAWLNGLTSGFGIDVSSLRVASADASFRRYLRIDTQAGSRIIMDAPPHKENSKPFVEVARLMAGAGLNAPEVLNWDETNGFMLLSDLGDQTMMAAINPNDADTNLPLYLQAVDALIAWQLASRPGVLPPYDAALLRRELELFPEWYVGRHRGLTVGGDIRQTLDAAFQLIIERNLAWPSVFVHRDFMPRNLMVAPTLPEGAHFSLGRPGGKTALPVHPSPLGILDFQDAVSGPITYDIASLMRDAFLSWDEAFVLDVTIRYWEKARKAGLPVGDDFGEFYQGVEWMGLQRHLKVAGIFARLTLRDGKPKYLADAPRFIQYIHATASRYIELRPLQRLVERLEGLSTATGYAYGRI